MNGETNDIYIGRGEKMFDVNAGVYGATPSPTTSWGTWMPTMDGTMPPSASIPVTPPTSDQPTFKPSPAPVIPPPTTSAPSLSPVTDAPTTPPSNATRIEEQEDIVKTTAETFEVRSTVLVELGNLNSQMNDDDTILFESVCDDFLNENLVLATPPIYNVTCDVISQTIAAERRRRYLKSGSHLLTISLQRALAGSLTTEAEVTGIVEQTESIQEPADVPFDDLLVGTFNVQGEFFLDALKEESLLESSTFETSEYFAQVDSVKATPTYEGSGAEESVDETGKNESFFNKGAIAAIVAGGVILIVLILLVIRKGKRRRASSSAAKASSESKASPRTRKPSLVRRLSGSFGARNVPPPPPPTISSSPTKSVRTYITDDPTSPIRSLTYVEPSASAMSRDAMDGEFEAVDSGLSTPPSPPKITSKRPPSKSTSNRIRRDVWAPSGKLGIMVANTSGYGPAIHTIRPGSPLEGLVFVSDIIAAINDVDTKHFTAEQITQVMKDTALEARKITVLSAHKG